MLICSEKNNVTQFSDKLSVFVEAATHLACAFHEETANFTYPANGSLRSAFGNNAYSLDASDDELEDAQPSTAQQVQETQPVLLNRFTTSMLQNALASTGVNTGLNLGAIQTPSDSNVNQPSTSSSDSQSIQFNQNFNNNPNSNPSNDLPTNIFTNQSTAASSKPARDWSKELSTMRELGLSNDRISRQVLEVTNGNIEQAVNLYWVLLDDQTN